MPRKSAPARQAPQAPQDPLANRGLTDEEQRDAERIAALDRQLGDVELRKAAPLVEDGPEEPRTYTQAEIAQLIQQAIAVDRNEQARLGAMRSPSTAARAAAAAYRSISAPGEKIKVQATRMGYCHEERKREGDVFWIEPWRFSENWMVRVPDDVPEHTSSSPEALRRRHEEIREGRAPASSASQPGIVLNEPSFSDEVMRRLTNPLGA